MPISSPGLPRRVPSSGPSPHPLRLLIAGGGTGGHLYPGVALAQEVVARGGEVSFVGTARGLEARKLPQLGYELSLLDVQGIKGRGLGGLVAGLLRLPRSYLQSRAIIRSFAPHVVVGVGGYASGPVVATAALMGLPTAILEQNSVPGITNRILSRLVREVYITFPDRLGRFPARKIVDTGNPIRREIVGALSAVTPGAAPEARNGTHLLVFGGSQGARAINQAFMEAAPELARIEGLRIRHQSGEADRTRVAAAYEAAGFGDRAAVTAFISDMANAYAWSDFAVCRSGATSVCELAVAGRPAVFIPFPHATDDHQTHNAAALVELGAARLLPQAELSTPALVKVVTELSEDAPARVNMARAMAGAGRKDAAARIHDRLVGLL